MAKAEVAAIVAGPKPILKRLVIPKEFKRCEAMWKRYGDFFPYTEPGTALVVYVGPRRQLRLFVWENFPIQTPWIVRVGIQPRVDRPGVLLCCASGNIDSAVRGITDTVELDVLDYFDIGRGKGLTTIKCHRTWWSDTPEYVVKPLAGKVLPVLLPLAHTRGRIKDPVQPIVTRKELPNATPSPNPSSDRPNDTQPDVRVVLPERTGCDCHLCRLIRERDALEREARNGNPIHPEPPLIDIVPRPRDWVETGSTPPGSSGDAPPITGGI